MPDGRGAPTVSVVLKSYNHAAFIDQAIRSVLDQDFTDFELVITDDGSSDATPGIIGGFHDSRISFEAWKENCGISNAMNATIARSTGTYIAILNSDDFMLPGRLSTQVAYLQAHPEVAAVFSAPLVVNEAGQTRGSFVPFDPPFGLPDFSSATWLRQFFFHGNCLCAPTAMVRRTAYDTAGPYEPRMFNLQDLDMWVRIASRDELHVLRQPLSAFRVLDDGRNTSAPGKSTWLRSDFEMTRILARYATFPPEVLQRAFRADCDAAQIDRRHPTEIWLAELALYAGTTSHRVFALQTLFDATETIADQHRLRELTGSVDVFNTWALHQRDDEIRQLRRIWSPLHTKALLGRLKRLF
eukprot:gene12947-13047_t